MVLEIQHRGGYLDPIDDCEQLCLQEMKRDLDRLPVAHGTWRD